MNIVIKNADIVTAFDEMTIGSKVTKPEIFNAIVKRAVEITDFEDQKVPGQAFIKLTGVGFEGVHIGQCVSPGNDRQSIDVEDYVIRSHRGKVGLYLQRRPITESDSVAVVVYTTEAYLNDPDVVLSEADRVSGATHVLVAVIASQGNYTSPLSPGRFVKNLAGGNHNMDEDKVTVAELKRMAKEIADYYDTWCTVSD